MSRNGSATQPVTPVDEGASSRNGNGRAVGEAAVSRLLELVGEDPSRDGLVDTPARVVRSLLELTAGYEQDPAEILGHDFEVAYDELVVVEDIGFWSLCEHHLLPFHGTVTIGYLPNGRVVGLSKLARLVHVFARRLQVQERLAEEIAGSLARHIEAHGVAVHIEAQHLCMAMRGVRSPATTVTRSFKGALREGEHRREFLDRIRHGRRGS